MSVFTNIIKGKEGMNLMQFDKTEPEKFYSYIKNEKGFPEEFIEEIYLVAKLSTDIEIKSESTEVLKKTADEDILRAFKNRSKFSEKKDYKARRKNLLLLLKLARLSSTLKIGKMYQLLEVNEDFKLVMFNDDLKLETIPQEIGRLDGIKELYLNFDSANMTIPDTISNITSLESLEISGFGIKELPKAISRLKNLKKLRIELHNIIEIPEWITECEALEELEFGGYGSFRHIKYIKLPQLKELKNLKTLDIHTIETEEIEEEFFDLPQLEHFRIANVKGLKAIPSSIKKIKGLKSFKIGNCPQLEQLPLEITELNHLESLWISSLPELKALDGRILFMPGVKELILRGIQSQIDMSDIGTSQIKMLIIKDIQVLKQFLDYGDRFIHLEKLTIEECKGLEAIPNSIGRLKALKHLKIVQSDIKTLPDSIGELDSLETLEIRGKLETFPNTLSNLKKLKTFAIGSSELTFSCKSLPSSIDKLSIGAKSIDLVTDITLAPREITLSANEYIGSDNLYKYQGVEDFWISGADVGFENISRLTSLKRLYMNRYDGDITDEVDALTKLEYIEISNGNVDNKKEKVISPLLGGLPQLKTLKIIGWLGETILDIISKSDSLEVIDLSDVESLNNHETFEQFVEILRNKKNLKSLYLHKIEVTNEMFKRLTQLTQLEGLKIALAPLDIIPETILNMRNLKFLSLRHLLKMKKQLPDWIGELKSLENLELEYLGIHILPETLADLPLLKRLSIYGMRPKEVPEELKNLNLEELKVRSSKGWPIRQSVLDVLVSKDTKVVWR